MPETQARIKIAAVHGKMKAFLLLVHVPRPAIRASETFSLVGARLDHAGGVDIAQTGPLAPLGTSLHMTFRCVLT